MDVIVRAVVDADRPWLQALVEQQWGIPVVTPIAVYDTQERHDGVVAEIEGRRAGAVTYVRDGRGPILAALAENGPLALPTAIGGLAP